MSTQLERARQVVADFVPQDKSGNHYVYAYLGKASYDATQYEIIDGLCLSSKRIWHLDESQTDCVAYVGEGCNGRIDTQRRHPFVPVNSYCRIKLCEGLSKNDAQELERLLIAELGCLLDDERSDGCLANIRYYYQGPHCCKYLEAFYHKQDAARLAAAATSSVETFAMKVDKTIIASGFLSELARQFGFCPAAISRCCAGERAGIWSPHLNQAIYFCRAAEYQQYKIKPMTTQQYSRHRILIAAKLNGSDICCGTAAEIGACVPEIKNSGRLHQVASGERNHAFGWTARYADELEAPVATCGPNLSAFF